MYSAWCGPLFMSSERFEEYTFSIQQPTTQVVASLGIIGENDCKNVCTQNISTSVDNK